MNKKANLEGTNPVYKAITVILLILVVLFFLFPLYWIISGSFKTDLEINAREPVWFPSTPTMEYYQELFNNPAFLWLFNIIFISAMAMILTCITAALAGYALGKKRFYGQTILFTIIICAMALPKQVIVIPLSQMLADMHLRNTLWAVILPTVGWPFGVFLMKQFSETVPTEILEAARVDGAGEFRTFFQVSLPLLAPGIVTTSLFTIVATWNNYFLPLIMLKDADWYPLTIGLNQWKDQANTAGGTAIQNLVITGSLITIIPLVIAFLLLQKYWPGPRC